MAQSTSPDKPNRKGISPSVEEVQQLAEKLAKTVLAFGQVEPNIAPRKRLGLHDMARLTRSLADTALHYGEPKASILLRLASVELSGDEKAERSEELIEILDTLSLEGR